MIKQKNFLLLLLFSAAALLVFFLSRSPLTPTASDKKVTVEQKSTLSLNVDGQKQDFDISGFVGKSALEATLGTLSNVKMSGTGTNAFITSIAGRTADSKKNEFWELVINGKSAEVGAGSYTINTGDQIEWRINTY